MVAQLRAPPPIWGGLPELTRYRKTRIDLRSAEIARLEKVLQDAWIKAQPVASKVLPSPGGDDRGADRRRARPIGAGPLAKGKLPPKIPQLTAAVHGHFGAHHTIVAARILTHLDFLDDTIAELGRRDRARVAGRSQQAVRLLAEIPSLERRSMEVIIAETGPT